MPDELKSIPQVWRKAFSSPGFRMQLIVSIIIGIAVYAHNFYYLRVWQARQGVQLNDLILNQLTPYDFSWYIFALEYVTMILAIIYILPYPDRFVKGIQAFALFTLMRTITIYFFVLEPPRDMIVLNDPFANFFLHSKDVFVTKDLFFSGHIASLVLLMFLVTNKYLKSWIFVATILVGILLLWQHVHYSLDVIFAPVVSFVSFKAVAFVHQQTKMDVALQSQE